MMKIIIDGTMIQNKEDLYQAMDDVLHFPEYFGHNLDALYDVLTERTDRLTAEFFHYDLLTEKLGEEFCEQLCRVFMDADAAVVRQYE